MDRKSFIKKTTNAMLIGIPFFSILSCSDDDGPAPTPADTDCLMNGTSSSVGSNHGHSITVSIADVMAGVEKQYSIQGSASHNHTITVLASNFSALQNNTQIQLSSTTSGGHNHSVTIRCA